jgi:cation:H+ antiporter
MFALLADPSWAADYPVPAIVLGLAMLVGGADLLVRGAVWMALVLGMSRMAVGLTLVAIGTSMPELMVSISAARNGYAEIAMANVIGSNTANVLLIVGVTALIRAIKIQVKPMELGYMLLATALAGVPFLWGHEMSRLLGAAMVLMLVAFCAQLLHRERHLEGVGEGERPHSTLRGWLLNPALFAGGLTALIYGAEWLVEGSVRVASSLGMSQAMIGMTIVAVGTSLPELATSAVAARKGQPEIAIGNVIGSNIFNVGAVLGVAGLLQPFRVEFDSLWRLMAATALSAIALVVVLRLRFGVDRPTAALFTVSYFAYLALEGIWFQ